MSRTAMWAAALLFLASWAGAGRGDMTIDEARALAERALGWSMEGWEVQTPDGYGANTLITFVWGGRRCTVDASSGTFRGYSRTWLDTGQRSRLSEEQALAVAKREAERIMGPLSASLEWRKAPPRVLNSKLEPVQRPRIDFIGEGPNAADPPRVGLAPRCWVSVDLSDGKVFRYWQTIPCEPVPVSVSTERAQEIARREIGDPAGGIMKCELHQDGMRAYWLVKIRTPAEPQFTKEWDKDLGVMGYHYAPGQTVKLYWIDAVTGEVFFRDAPGGGPGGIDLGAAGVAGQGDAADTASARSSPTDEDALQTASAVPAGQAPPPQPPSSAGGTPALPVAGAAVGLLLCAGAAVFLMRRRR